MPSNAQQPPAGSRQGLARATIEAGSQSAPLGRLLPRAPVSVLSGRTKAPPVPFPEIIPPAEARFCQACASITPSSLFAARDKSITERDGKQYVTSGGADSRITVTYTDIRQSLEHCPLCRLVACDAIWESGSSPFSLLRDTDGATLQLQFELHSGKVTVRVPADQHGLQQDTADVEVFTARNSIDNDLPGRPWRGMTAGSTFQAIHDHLVDCLCRHPSCEKLLNGADVGNSPPLPDRLVYVGSTDSPTLRLEETKGKRGRYVALSHCWGAALEAMTTSLVYTSYLAAIDEDILSPMLIDVFRICRLLQYTHIWIDSLCIIQDIKKDWEEQAPKMGLIYENAQFTLAMTDGQDGDYRPLDEAKDVYRDTYVVQLDNNPDKPGERSLFLRPKKLASVWTPRFLSAPLNRRGWVVQERLLSRRILHFTEGMIYYECDQLFTALNGDRVGSHVYVPQRVQLLTVNLEGPITADSYDDVDEPPVTYEQDAKAFWDMVTRLREIWSDVVGDYNVCRLTRDSDKLPAIAGLAQSIKARTGLLYHCGIFLDAVERVPLQLLWMPSEGALIYRSHAPTWSWAAYHGRVELWDLNYDVFAGSGWFPLLRGDYAATIDELVPPHPGDESDASRFGALVVTAPIKLARRSDTRDFGREDAHADAETLEIPLHGWPRQTDCNARSFAVLDKARPAPGEANKFKGWVCFDGEGDEADEPEMFCVLPIIKTTRIARANRTSDGRAATYVSYRFLAVVRVMLPPGRAHASGLAFQRVGYGEVFGESWLDGVAKMQFLLV